MKTKLLSIDIFLGERFFRTMFIAPTKVQLLFNENSVRECIDLNAVCDEVRHRLPSLRHRKDMHIYLNN